MDIILLFLAIYWLAGIFGFRKRKPRSRKSKSSYWNDPSYLDWEWHKRCNER